LSGPGHTKRRYWAVSAVLALAVTAIGVNGARQAAAQFENPVVQNAYAKAAKVKKVLYQQPCYCHCDRSLGHGSLLDCFASKHGSMCDVCIKEAFYSYEQTLKKKTAEQIRA